MKVVSVYRFAVERFLSGRVTASVDRRSAIQSDSSKIDFVRETDHPSTEQIIGSRVRELILSGLFSVIDQPPQGGAEAPRMRATGCCEPAA